MADLDDEKGSQNVGPDKPPRDGESDASEHHQPKHEPADPDSDVETPSPGE